MLYIKLKIRFLELIMPIVFGILTVISLRLAYLSGQLADLDYKSFIIFLSITGYTWYKIESGEVTWKMAQSIIFGVLFIGLLLANISIYYLNISPSVILIFFFAYLFAFSSLFYDFSDAKKEIKKLEEENY